MKKGFFDKVKREWKKITWLTQDEVKKQTSIVVVTMAFLGVLLTALDLAGQWIVNLVLGIHF